MCIRQPYRMFADIIIATPPPSLGNAQVDMTIFTGWHIVVLVCVGVLLIGFMEWAISYHEMPIIFAFCSGCAIIIIYA